MAAQSGGTCVLRLHYIIGPTGSIMNMMMMMMMMIMMNMTRMTKFILYYSECVGGCVGRLLIDLPDHTHIAHSYRSTVVLFASFAVLSSLTAWRSVSALGVQHQ